MGKIFKIVKGMWAQRNLIVAILVFGTAVGLGIAVLMNRNKLDAVEGMGAGLLMMFLFLGGIFLLAKWQVD